MNKTERLMQNAEKAALELLKHSSNARSAWTPLQREFYAQKYEQEIATIEESFRAMHVVFCRVIVDAVFETTAAVRNGRKV